jgi:hypothetical protein
MSKTRIHIAIICVTIIVISNGASVIFRSGKTILKPTIETTIELTNTPVQAVHDSVLTE